MDAFFYQREGLFPLFILPLIQLYTDEYVITNKRVIIKKGWLNNRALEMYLQKIETVNVDQSVTGKILEYGCITIIGK
ncbi:MAG: PH domain-containing protein [Chitinophagaceae bacterium]|nr:PH domain-containing protein [Chitinophagaceae bacterium]